MEQLALSISGRGEYESGFGLRWLRWHGSRLVLGRGFLGLYLAAGGRAVVEPLWVGLLFAQVHLLRWTRVLRQPWRLSRLLWRRLCPVPRCWRVFPWRRLWRRRRISWRWRARRSRLSGAKLRKKLWSPSAKDGLFF